MTTKPKQNKELLKLFSTNAKKWNAQLNENFTSSIDNVKATLTTKTTFLQDTVLAMYVANNDIASQSQVAVQQIQKSTEDNSLNQAINLAYDAISFNVHLENVLNEMHSEGVFADMYRLNQYYHFVQRFVSQEMIIPVGFKLVFEQPIKENETKKILVTVDAETKISDLFDSAFFGCFMPLGKSEEEKQALVFNTVNASVANILNDAQFEDIKTNGKHVETFQATDLIAKYQPQLQEKLPKKSA